MGSKIKKKIDLPDAVEILRSDLRMVFTQPSDCCSSEEQFLEIKSDNGGGGNFYILKTERWAVDDTSSVSQILKFYEDKLKLVEVTI